MSRALEAHSTPSVRAVILLNQLRRLVDDLVAAKASGAIDDTQGSLLVDQVRTPGEQLPARCGAGVTRANTDPVAAYRLSVARQFPTTWP